MLFGKIFALTLAALVAVKAQFMELPDFTPEFKVPFAFVGTAPIQLNTTMEGASVADPEITYLKPKYKLVHAFDAKRNLTAT